MSMKANGTILVVDDDLVTRNVVKDFLETAGYQVLSAVNGLEALTILREAQDQFDAMLLDRVMPQMDGMEVLRTIHAEGYGSDIPVIMLTAESHPDQIAEGVQSGAYYYIAKPFSEEGVLCVVRAAVEKFRQFRQAMSWGMEATAGLALLRRGEFRFRTLQEGRMAANLLADLAERPAPVLMGLMELIANGIENGNLGVKSQEKHAYLRAGTWAEEIQNRLYEEENIGKHMHVWFEFADEDVKVSIRDDGHGFDWQPYLHLDKEQGYDPHGQGLLIARQFCFDTITYTEGGRCAHVSFRAG